tara:strand:- start:1565 stop:1729 length:165 start_codon:yes stop_codon:yes gene_type:complete
MILESDLWIMVYVAMITRKGEPHEAAQAANQAVIDFRDVFSTIYNEDTGVDKRH